MKKLHEDIIEEFKQKVKEAFDNDNISMPDFYIKFLLSALSRQLDEIVKMIELSKKEMKQTHACRFNDGECDCECYLKALSDIIDKLKGS